jgi:DNA-binding CsgD family transcriptional regulator
VTAEQDVTAEQTESAIGRELELAALREFVQAGRAAQACVLTGGPGIGKTTLWEAGIGAARERGLRVLLARPSGAEARLAYATLIDLLDDVGADELAELPPPQRHALEVAILRTEPTASRLDPSAIAVGFLNALRSLTSRESVVVVAIDDLPWLDPSSADALVFAARRLQHESIRFLLARRPGSATALERAFEPARLQQLEVPPLSVGATRRLLSEQLRLSLPRRLLRRLFESAQGNPLFALELGRTLVDRAHPEIGEEIPFPERLEDLLGSRVAELSPEASTVLLALALSTDLRVSQLESLAESSAIDEALDAGVVAVDGDRVRLAHPLFGAAALRRSRPRQRAQLHRDLALAIGDDGRRARHLALASAAADPDLAAVLAAAASSAAARGARYEAVELAEHALRLTPPERPERTERLLALAEYLAKAGEPGRVTALLKPEVEALPHGAARARAWLLLSDGTGASTQEEYLRHLDRALAESEGDAALRAAVLARLANNAAAVLVARMHDAEAWASEALTYARGADPDVEQLALYALAWARSFRGRPIDDLLERVPEHGDALYLRSSLDRVACDRFAWRGQVREARAIARRLMSVADERGESRSYLALLSQLCEIELRAGELDVASQLLDDWEQSSSDRFVAPVYERCRSLVAVYRGRPDEAKQWVADVIVKSEMLGKSWDLLEGLRAQGIAELFAHEPERAVTSLRRIWRYTEQEGIEDPGAFPVAPDLVEALVELGEFDEAREVSVRLRELAERQEHPWGLVTAERCGALLRLAAPAYDEQAAADLAVAAAGYGNLGLRFDRARVLLSLGRVQRRLRKWKAARGSLEQAAVAFDEVGSAGWAEAARSELARVGARRPRAAGELTEAERRVVELAVEGLSNKEIARALVVTVPTVEAHLSRSYAKLGVRSRTQLAGRLSLGGSG